MMSENARISSRVVARAEFVSVLTAGRAKLHKVVVERSLTRVGDAA